MQIPLDYYRILGIPIQVTHEQLQQAYQDRSLQLPRREYSENAIALRKQLLDEAYEVLSDGDKRSQYDSQFLEKAAPLDSSSPSETPSTGTPERKNSSFDLLTPWIDIRPEQLVGALVILQELGEYELVTRLGDSYLNDYGNSQDSQETRQDVILTMALAYLELSREQWQQSDYEKAADHGQQGLALLTQDHLFPSLQQEIKTDYNKLRPYRILELLSLPEKDLKKRKTGFHLLEEMLENRQGIDGKDNDGSGLSLDDFLRFIQQLRTYLTIKEQQKLFEAEAQRPSAVASYLRVYTLIAAGFAHKQPSCILQAKEMLKRLSKRQDVYLEKAICCLLLGQTQEATLAVEKSQDKNALKFIKEHSHNSPDLLPGLCAYGEKWLQTEVFAHFRDLISQKVSLTAYFADEKVQNELDQLSDRGKFSEDNSGLVREEKSRGNSFSSQSFRRENPSQTSRELAFSRSQNSRETYHPAEAFATASLVQTETSARVRPSQQKGYGEVTREYIGNVALSPSYREIPTKRPRYRRRRPKAVNPVTTAPLPPQSSPSISPRTKPKPKKFLKIQKFLLTLILLLGLGTSILWLKSWFNSRSSLGTLSKENLMIQLDEPPLQIPSADAHVVIAGALNQQNSQQMIQEWLSSKSQAFGHQHELEKLTLTLADPMLSLWQNRAKGLKESQSYYQYDHEVKVDSFKVDSQNPDRATVEANVREKAQFFQNGKLNQGRSYNDNLRIRYELIREKNQWKIKNSELII